MNNPGYQYPLAPIREAVIDLRFSGQFKQDTLEKMERKARRKYQNSKKRKDVNIQYDANQTENSKIEEHSNGFHMSSSDEADILLISRNSMATIRLAPYEGWGQLFSGMKENYEILKKEVSEFSVSRIGIRYINRIDIPDDGTGIVDASKYINVAPAFMSSFPGVLSGWGILLEKKLAGERFDVNLNVAKAPPTLLNHLSIILDIDIYTEREIPRRIDQVWDIVSVGRDLKNRIFEDAITDSARRLFNDFGA